MSDLDEQPESGDLLASVPIEPQIPPAGSDVPPNAINPVAPPGTGTKCFAVIGVAIMAVSLLAAIVLPIVLIWWLVKRS